jgi:IPT/TIG domain-containing protein/uncharacterized protein DUF1565
LRRIIVLLVGLAITTSALAFDPYVDAVNGNDSNDGSFNTPVRTIKKALTLVTASGTIHVRPGTYNTGIGETFPITMPSGIKLQSTAGAASTTIDATGANARVLLCSANSSSTLIEGFTITGGFYQQPADGNSATGGGIFMDNNDQTTIKRCIIAGNEARGYNGNGSFFSGGTAYGGGIGINNGVHSIVNTVFRNNIARGGNGFSPATIGYPGGDGHGGGLWDGAGTTTLLNDTFDANQSIGGNGANAINGNGGAGGIALYSAADMQNGTSTNTIFANNVDTGGSGGAGAGGGSAGANGGTIGALNATVASYNLFFNNTGGDGFTGTNAITAQDPLFVNPPVNLHLRSASPAKFAGTSTGAPTVDLENNPRPFLPSMGAYELGLFLTATGGIGRVTITWAGVSGASSYNLYYISGGGTVTTGSTKISGVTSPYVFGPVLNGTTWSFALTAVESSVEGPLGPQASATVSGGSGGPWVSAPTTGTSFTSIARDLANGNTLYATATDSVGLYKSTNAGDSWTPLTGPFNGLGMHAVAANGSTVLVAGQGAIYRSINGGTAWTTSFSGAGIGEDYINGLAIDPLNTNTVYAADFHIDFGTTSTYLLIKSTDGGATFHNLTDMSTANLRGYFLQVDPVTSGTLYAAGSGTPNIGKSANNGGTWTSVSPVAGYPTALALAPNLSVRLYAGMKDVDNTTVLGVYRSNSGGSMWTPINTGLGGGVINALLVDPTNADHVHAGASDGYYVSTDGTNWTSAAAGAGSHFINAFAQTTTRRLMATTSNSLIIMLPLDGAPNINANASPGSGTTDGGDVVTVSGSGFTVATGLRVLFGGTDGSVNMGTSTSTSLTVTTPIHAPGSVDVAVINPDGQAAIRTNAFTYNCSPATISPVSANFTYSSLSGSVQVIASAACSWTASAPGGSFVTITGGASGTGPGTVFYDVAGNLSATARSTTLTIAGIAFTVTQSGSGNSPLVLTHTTTPGQVALSWTASGGGTYEVRRSDHGSAFNLVTATSLTSYNDTTVTNGTGYLYQIYAINGGVVAYSNVNIAVPFNYTDASLSGVLIKALHFTEPRQAANAARVALGWPAFNFSDPSLAGLIVQGNHLTDIRLRINEVRAAVGTSAVAFTDPTLVSGTIVIKAIHILQVRGGL